MHSVTDKLQQIHEWRGKNSSRRRYSESDCLNNQTERGAAVMDGWQAERDGKTGRAWSASGHPRRRGHQADKRPIKQIKNNSRNYRPHWTGASPWMRRIEWSELTLSMEGVGRLDIFIRWLMLRGIMSLTAAATMCSCESRNAVCAALSLFLHSQVNILVWRVTWHVYIATNVFFPKQKECRLECRNDTRCPRCRAAEAFCQLWGKHSISFPFIVPFAAD